MKTNLLGLSRHIPADVKNEVRKKCGFGCVICAFPIIEYEHVDPVFVKANAHDPAGIALLCPNCHSKVTRRQYSKDKVIQAMQSPKALENGIVSDFFCFSDEFPAIQFGGVKMSECNIPIMVGGESLFEFTLNDGHFSLTGKFYDSKGNLSLEIIDNEWVCSTKIWDLEIIGPRIIIREKKNGPRLIINVGQQDTLVIESFEMLVKGRKLKGTKDYFMVDSCKLSSCEFSNCHVGFSV